jgi:hypothetical protein
VHLVCRPDGVPVRVQMLPAGVHDLVHELAYGLPAGARLLGDKAYNSAADAASILAETGVRLVPVRRANMRPHAWFMDDIELLLEGIGDVLEENESEDDMLVLGSVHAAAQRIGSAPELRFKVDAGAGSVGCVRVACFAGRQGLPPFSISPDQRPGESDRVNFVCVEPPSLRSLPARARGDGEAAPGVALCPFTSCEPGIHPDNVRLQSTR